MTFGIQVSNPRISGKKDSEDDTLDECVETCFLLNTEMALIEWFGVYIPLNYKYSISTILKDVLIMLEALLDKKNGAFDITWPSSDFNAIWIMSWKDDNLTIEAKWSTVIGKTEDMLNNLGALNVNKSEFIYEWKKLLETVINRLSQCGYSESDISDISLLKRIYSQINAVGTLYR
jgi:hypothetical protein